MKFRVLFPLLIAVVIGHAVFFWILPRFARLASDPAESWETASEAPAVEVVELAEAAEVAPPADVDALEEPDEPGARGADEAVGRAVDLVRHARDRAASVDAASAPSAAEGRGAPSERVGAWAQGPAAAALADPEEPDDAGLSATGLPSDAIPEGAMRVGRAGPLMDLPPELTEPARQGALAVAAEDWETARRHYLEMVRLAPGNALGYANLGVAEYQLGNLLAAAGNLTRSLEINPSIAQNWQTLGLIHYERGDLELAISSLTRALHEDASDARSRVYLAAVASDYGWRDAALLELQRAVESDPSLVDAHFNLALAYLDESPPRIELARRHYFAARDLGSPPAPEIEELLESDGREPEQPE